MRSILALSLVALAPLAVTPARAQDPAIPGSASQGSAAEESTGQPSPVGRWRTIDDDTKKPKSIVAITEEDGKLQGTIEELLDPNRPEPDPVCKKCEGERKNQPIRGMKILWGVKKSGDTWTGGKILDPNNGKVYRVNLTPADGGKKLVVRGYVGIALIGRTQTWERAE
ncbi:MAG TPA: DUF2147 domain-containing protein [Anaeromyxobacter sp.]|nr:DUF2147 domain-containing protein [Anaeromyxobacter sp.]